MRKETIQLTYEMCVQQLERWHALGRNYTAVQKAEYRGPEGYHHPACVIFHSLDLVNVSTGIRIKVTEGRSELFVEFPPSGRYTNDYSYPMDAVPVQPFRNKERVKAWEEFIDAMHGEDARGVRLQSLKMVAYPSSETRCSAVVVRSACAPIPPAHGTGQASAAHLN